MFEDLNEVQEKILLFIIDAIGDKNYMPSVREIGAHVGYSSTSSVQNQLNNLEKKGYIKRNPNTARAIELRPDLYDLAYKVEEEMPSVIDAVTPVSKVVNVPLIGRVTAGLPILAQENYEGYFPLPVEFTHDSECFMLTVSGSSMINIGIMDGDYIIVRKQNSARNGEVVVAMVSELEDEATVKTFYNEGNRIRLQPENDTMDPIYSKNVTILGKVIGSIRLM